MKLDDYILNEALKQFNEAIDLEFKFKVNSPCSPCLLDTSTAAGDIILSAEDLLGLAADATKLAIHLSHIEGEKDPS